MAEADQDNGERGDGDNIKSDKLFTLKKWNAVAMWSWDVECDTCAICRVQVMAGQVTIGHLDKARTRFPLVLASSKKIEKNIKFE
ncbi:hypothetical protein PV325_000070 [Microctonus aethiopoides]|nr:hypothetical protein PV325_000070 [Microctonus aethiopoides]